MVMQLPDILDELYSVPPAKFVAARNDRARAAREAGYRNLAEEIRTLPKPSAAAWAVNMLVRYRRHEIDQVLELGAALRQAQNLLDRAELRRLSSRRRDLVAAVAAAGQALTEELGQAISPSAVIEVEQTLHAAMADDVAATAVISGRLTRALTSTGWESIDISASVAVPVHAKEAPRPAKERATENQRRVDLAQATRDSADAERTRKRAEAHLSELQQQIDETGTRKMQLAGELAELHARVEDLEQERATIEDRSRFLARERDQLDRAVEQARRDADRARDRLQRLRQR